MDLYSISIDCAPFKPRPDVYFQSLVEKCSLKEEWFTNGSEPICKMFGEWTWNVKPEFGDQYKQKALTVGEFLSSLYNSGAIRCASW